MAGFVRRHQLLIGLALVLVVGTVSVALTMQGWRSRLTAFDLLTYVYSADEFLRTGALPQHGDTGSYGSHKPPGTAWLMMPSRLLSTDPRLAEYAGTAVLHLAALAGIFLLARRYFGMLTAVAAVVLYGLSAHGIFLAGSLWPNGRPDFFVLAVLLASQWVMRRDAKFLAAGVGLLAVGMYVDMALAPALFIFPVLWVYYRPPVRPLPLIAAATVVLLVWFPYLQFEVGRGFADLKSQLFLQSVFPEDYTSVWCDTNRQLLTLGSADAGQTAPNAPAPGSLGWPARVVGVALLLGEKALSNFTNGTLVPGGGIVLGAMVGISMVVFSVPGAGGVGGRSRFSRRALLLLGAALVTLGALTYLLPLAELLGYGGDENGTARRAGVGLASIGAALFVIPAAADLANRLLAARGVRIQSAEEALQRRFLVLSLLVPWLILVAIAEPGKPERFWWLWPLQLVFLAGFAFRLLPRFTPRSLAVAAQVLIVAVLLLNPELTARLSAWSDAGWAGADAPEVEVVDYVGERLRDDGRDEAAIGYQTIIYPFMATYHITNPLYKVGAEFDLLLWYRHGIANTNDCAEGLSDEDEIRIVQTRRKPPEWAPDAYFDARLGPDFRLAQDLGLYQVWLRPSVDDVR